MITQLYRRSVHLVIILSILLLSVGGCVSTETKLDISKPPQLPPEVSFVMDFKDFTSSGISLSTTDKTIQLVSFTGSSDTRNYALGDHSNWSFATFNVGFWNAVVSVGLIVPVASFIESFKHTPTQQDDYSWIWTYDVIVDGIVYIAELHGKYIDNGVRWEMYVSKQSEYSDFLWYYGESNLPATQGYWILMNKPTVPGELLRIDWHRNLAKKTGDIKYTNIVPDGPEKGAYIYYEVKQSTDYNRSYEIYNKGKNNTTYIEWNSETKSGRVKDALYFSDSDWHGWNSQLLNIESQ